MQKTLQQQNLCCQQIKSYIRIFPSLGIDPILNKQYQIIDGNTILHKKQKNKDSKDSKDREQKQQSKYKMYSFNYIFNCQFQNWKQLEHMNIIDDCFQGKNQIIVMDVHKQFFQLFLNGTVDDPAFIISLFNSLFNQTLYSTSNNQPQTTKRIKKQQNISISIFSTQNDTNKFIDLIIGQKFIFYSKKDMDQHKDFYYKQIIQMRQFLIVLKIAYIHYKEYCKQGDPIVFKIIVDSYDEVKKQNYMAMLHLVVCQTQSKITQDIRRKLQFSLKNTQLKGQDHGSLANYLQKYLRKSKIIYIYGIPFRKNIMHNSIPMFKFLCELKNHKTQFQSSKITLTPQQKIQQINKFKIPLPKYNSYNFNQKQINICTQLLQKLCQFLIETQTKWRNYCQVFQQILSTQQQFYQKQRFPISLQIQQYNIKSYLISKIYRLSQTYQMDDLSLQMQKLRTIKNQIIISYKAIINSKQIQQLPSIPIHLDIFNKYFKKCMNSIFDILKILLGFNYRNVKIYQLDIKKNIQIENILGNKILKNFINKLKNQGKKIQEKQLLCFRKVQMEKFTDQVCKISLSQSIQQSSRTTVDKNIVLSTSKSYQLYKRQKRLNNILNPINLPNMNSSQHNKQKKPLKRKNILTSIIKNNSTLNTKQSQHANYNFSLPKIAIIHRKNTKK